MVTIDTVEFTASITYTNKAFLFTLKVILFINY